LEVKLKNRNKKIEHLVYSAVNDFTRIVPDLSLEKVDEEYVILVNRRRAVTVSRFYEDDEFYVHFICLMETNIEPSRAFTLKQIIEDKEVKEFLEYYYQELILDQEKELLQISMWDFPYADYAILKSSIVFLLTETFRNMNKTFELLEEKEKEYEKAKLN